jgi:hypothetical protein
LLALYPNTIKVCLLYQSLLALYPNTIKVCLLY